MPYVAESLIVLQHDKLVALIYPDFADAFAHGLQQNDIQKAMEVNRVELNKQLPNYLSLIHICTPDEDIRSLKELVHYGLKGMAAYVEHAHNLGYQSPEILSLIHI